MRLIQSWEAKRQYENQYKTLLIKLGRAISQNIQNEEDINSIIDILDNMTFNEEYVHELVSTIMNKVRRTNDITWNQHIQVSKEIYAGIINQITKSKLDAVMNTIIATNVAMITKLPQTVSRNISSFIKDQTLKGVRASDMIKEIKQRVPNITDNSARLMARTQVSMTQSALTEARSQALNIKWYVWRTSEDERVRNSHEHMEGVLVPWNYKPSPESLIGMKSQGNYHAGNTYNCRCYAQPVVNVNRISFPAKVFWNNRVVKMSKEEFEIINK